MNPTGDCRVRPPSRSPGLRPFHGSPSGTSGPTRSALQDAAPSIRAAIPRQACSPRAAEFSHPISIVWLLVPAQRQLHSSSRPPLPARCSTVLPFPIPTLTDRPALPANLPLAFPPSLSTRLGSISRSPAQPRNAAPSEIRLVL